MKPARLLTYLVVLTGALTLTVKSAQVALTEGFLDSLAAFGRALISNLAIQFILIGTAVLFLLSLCAAAWDRSERRYERANRERAEEIARRFQARPIRTEANVDTSSLLDDSPAPLPETWRAPCGEPIRFPSSTNDRGADAA